MEEEGRGGSKKNFPVGSTLDAKAIKTRKKEFS